jgi:hypothetical protein
MGVTSKPYQYSFSAFDLSQPETSTNSAFTPLLEDRKGNWYWVSPSFCGPLLRSTDNGSTYETVLNSSPKKVCFTAITENGKNIYLAAIRERTGTLSPNFSISPDPREWRGGKMLTSIMALSENGTWKDTGITISDVAVHRIARSSISDTKIWFSGFRRASTGVNDLELVTGSCNVPSKQCEVGAPLNAPIGWLSPRYLATTLAVSDSDQVFVGASLNHTVDGYTFTSTYLLAYSDKTGDWKIIDEFSEKNDPGFHDSHVSESHYLPMQLAITPDRRLIALLEHLETYYEPWYPSGYTTERVISSIIRSGLIPRDF